MTEPLRPRDSQRIHEKDGVCYQERQVHNLQNAGGYDKVPQLKKVSGLYI